MREIIEYGKKVIRCAFDNLRYLNHAHSKHAVYKTGKYHLYMTFYFEHFKANIYFF